MRFILKWTLRLGVLYALFVLFFILGTQAVAGQLSEPIGGEPGLVSPESGVLIIALGNVLVILALILTSGWHGWKLALSLSLSYYGAVTLLSQIEAWYFLGNISISPGMLRGLFLMGVPTAFGFIPLAVWILGKWRVSADPITTRPAAIPPKQWLWKLALVAFFYLLLYWGAGYFIAWQNPELRAFYGQPGPALPFFAHTAETLRQEPGLFPLQILRSMIWVLCALPVIRGSKVGPWGTALVVGLLFSVPQNIGHIIANPLMPVASVRLSHLVETASSTFLFGTLVVWLLHRRHESALDLFQSRDRSAIGMDTA